MSKIGWSVGSPGQRKLQLPVESGAANTGHQKRGYLNWKHGGRK